ncbi:MAG: hypothetical protein JW726_16385 [Anaerolineales bacterium]|nr:hypothetical protein [Anaerolineales bacterium]
MHTTLSGWLLDIYADEAGAVVWLLGEDGQRYHLRQDFPATFYVGGEGRRLRAAWRFLQSQPEKPLLKRTERRDLFEQQPVAVLAAQLPNPTAQTSLFRRLAQAFPDLDYYDVDLPLALRHAASYGTFPLARCRVDATEEGNICALVVLDTPWELDVDPPPLRMLHLEPDIDPMHSEPRSLLVRAAQNGKRRGFCRLSLSNPRPLLLTLAGLLQQYDPDLLLTTWGDTWLLPRLLDLARQWHVALPLNRDARRGVARRAARTYVAYGQVIHRGQQVLLHGRWHIDGCNAMLFHDYGLEGIMEMARVTGLPLQLAARLSPGSGISAMQMITALRQEVLVPWHKQQAEAFKPASDLLYADQGGLVYHPIPGLHAGVAEIDFVSMYPSIMARFNISPETTGPHVEGEAVPGLGLAVDCSRPGLIPQTLAPLLEKRLALKRRLMELPAWDPRRESAQACASAHKWLLVTCFGYLGYQNARFGRIEAHQAVTAYGREALLRAKEAAEEMGFTVLHLYVDGLWVHRPGAQSPATLQPLLEEITTRSGLPIALEGIYRWVAFLPSRGNGHVAVANRYFGVFQDGRLKIRGIEARRGDTPPWIAEVQMVLVECLAQAGDEGDLPVRLSQALRRLRAALDDLRGGRVAMEGLIVSQKLSRELALYRVPSPAAQAAEQLAACGKPLRPGQRVRFLYTLGKPGVHAWDLPNPCAQHRLDLARYRTLLLRAAGTVLQPFGMDEQALCTWADSAALTPLLWGTPARLTESARIS